jgi:hypothetical protein
MRWESLEVGIKMKWGVVLEKRGGKGEERAKKRARILKASFGCWSERVGG